MKEAKKDYQDIYYRLENLKKKYRSLNDNEQEMAQRLDLLQFQQQELTEAQLVPQEDTDLEEERNQLANYEKKYINHFPMLIFHYMVSSTD